MKNFNVDSKGCYGEFGGSYVPEALASGLKELQNSYVRIIESPGFAGEYWKLLEDYVGRPSPLYYARRLSDKYGARIYLKREDLNHTGAHKINNAVGQVLLAGYMGKKRMIAETGAGQHGVAVATVCALLGMECTVYMGAMDIARQGLNVSKMKMLGAEVASVETGGKGLKEAVDAAIGDWCENQGDTYYIIGSAVGPHPYPDMVARFQSVISKEIKSQLREKEGRDYPDYLIACIGGGSNAAGTFYHYLADGRVRLIAAEAAGLGLDSGRSAATLNLGGKGMLHGSVSMVMRNAEGDICEPYSISAGLDYPGIGPMLADMFVSGRLEAMGITDEEALRAALDLTCTEGIIPAVESAHALAVLEKKRFGPDEIVVLTVSGRGDKDIETYLGHYASGNKDTPFPAGTVF